MKYRSADQDLAICLNGHSIDDIICAWIEAVHGRLRARDGRNPKHGTYDRDKAHGSEEVERPADDTRLGAASDNCIGDAI